jgi:hypothetical protein
MSGRRQSQRPNQIKREHEDGSDNIAVTAATANPPKRQRKEFKGSKTTHRMSVSATTLDVPDTVLQVYHHMLPKTPEGVAFLFGSRFSEALQVAAIRAAIGFKITTEAAIEEFRRFLAIKAFTVDEDANKISPTPLSTLKHPNHPSCLMLSYKNSG